MKLSQVQVPGVGRVDISRASSWLEMILGAAVLAIVLGIGAFVARAFQRLVGRVPTVGPAVRQLPVSGLGTGLARNVNPSATTTRRPVLPLAV